MKRFTLPAAIAVAILTCVACDDAATSDAPAETEEAATGGEAAESASAEGVGAVETGTEPAVATGTAPAEGTAQEASGAPAPDATGAAPGTGDVAAAGDAVAPGVTLAQLQIEFPDVPLDAEAGARAFAPREQDLIDYAADPTSTSARLAMYAHTIESVGPTHSMIRGEYTEPFSCPNALIIPVPPNQQASVGSVIVGSSVSRASTVYVTGGTPDAPVGTTFNGNDYGNARIAAGTWIAATEPGQPGTNLHCTIGPLTRQYTSVRSSGDQRLVFSFFNEPHVVPAADCTPLPLSGLPAVGDTIRALHNGSVRDLVVTEVHPEEGQVSIEAEVFGEMRVKRYQIGDFIIAPATP